MDEEKQTVSEFLSLYLDDPRGKSDVQPNADYINKIVRREFGVYLTAQNFNNCNDIDDVAAFVTQHLPRLPEGKSIITIFDIIRKIIAKGVRWPIQDIRWDTLWGMVDEEIPEMYIYECLKDLGIPNKSYEPYEDELTVGDTVRNIWHILGGEVTWEEPSYEQNWCSTQQIFYDVKAMVRQIHRFRSQRPTTFFESIKHILLIRVKPPQYCASEDGAENQIKPSDEISRWVKPGKEELMLLHWIKAKFGTWLSNYPSEEPHSWVIYSGILLYLAAMILPAVASVVFRLSFVAVVPLFISIFFGGGYLLVKWSHAKFLPKIKTFRDLVLMIRNKRADVLHKPISISKPRIRPILME